jgi:hypothetical protein
MVTQPHDHGISGDQTGIPMHTSQGRVTRLVMTTLAIGCAAKCTSSAALVDLLLLECVGNTYDEEGTLLRKDQTYGIVFDIANRVIEEHFSGWQITYVDSGTVKFEFNNGNENIGFGSINRLTGDMCSPLVLDCASGPRHYVN